MSKIKVDFSKLYLPLEEMYSSPGNVFFTVLDGYFVMILSSLLAGYISIHRGFVLEKYRQLFCIGFA